jgi:glycosyltransferase involved in cell wall biosynthesis
VEGVSRRRILLVTPFAPAPAGRHGGGRAVHGLATQLAARHDVVLLHIDRDEIDPEVAERCVAVHAVTPPDPGPWGVRARGIAAFARGRSLKAAALAVAEMQRRVAELTRSFAPDVVQVETGVLGDVLARAGAARRVITLYEPAASLGEGLALREDGLPFVHRVDARVALREERRVLGLADAAVLFTERDRRLVAQSARPRAELVTIPLGWDVPDAACDPTGADPPTLLFVANFVHPPNVDAALTLARRIFPLVRAEHPAARLQIVGKAPPPQLRALAGAAVEVTGEVPSVVPYLDRAAVVVVPIALGGGMRVKVLEALAAGKAVVASTRAAEGIGAAPGEELLIADGDAETAAAAGRLLADAAARRRLGLAARAWAQRELAWATMADRYDELYARLAPRSGRNR